jgi:hypothetical protein
MSSIIRNTSLAALLTIAAAGVLGCGETTFVTRDTLPLAQGVTVVKGAHVLGVDNHGDINVMVLTGPRSMTDRDLRRAEEATLQQQGWKPRKTSLTNGVGFTSESAYATLVLGGGVDDAQYEVSRLKRTFVDLRRDGRPVVIASLAPRRE